MSSSNYCFIFLGSKITADGDCNHKIKRCLLLGRKAMTNLERIKTRDIALTTKVCLVKAMVFSTVMYGCESWTMKKAECQRMNAFELWWWRRLLKVPWTARSLNQSIIKEINPEYSLEGLMLKLKLQYFAHLMWRTDSLEKTLMLGKIGGRREGDGRGRDGWMASLTQWAWVWTSSGSWWWRGKPAVLQSMGWQRVGQNWAEVNWTDGFQSVHFMANRWGNNGNNDRFYFWGVQNQCIWFLQPQNWNKQTNKQTPLLLRRKAITNLDSVLKSRDITLLTKVWIVRAMVFPVVMNGCESWTIKKAENQRIDAFELWCWRSFFRVPWTDAKLKLQYFAHLKGPTYWKIQSSVQFSCSSSIIPFSSWLQYSQHQGLFQ